MKIEDNRTDKGVLFTDLAIGDCFIYGKALHIKINLLCVSPNAFDLTNNDLCTIKNDALTVTKINAKVVIE